MGAKTKIEWTRGKDGSPGATWTPIRTRNTRTGKVGAAAMTAPEPPKDYNLAGERKTGLRRLRPRSWGVVLEEQWQSRAGEMWWQRATEPIELPPEPRR